MRVSDASTNGEPKPGTSGFCREEGLEDPSPKTLGDSRARVLYLYIYPILSLSMPPPCVYAELSALTHRFYRIQKKVQEELLDLCRINCYEESRASQFSAHGCPSLFKLTPKER
jgi:hypothetical protein